MTSVVRLTPLRITFYLEMIMVYLLVVYLDYKYKIHGDVEQLSDSNGERTLKRNTWKGCILLLLLLLSK